MIMVAKVYKYNGPPSGTRGSEILANASLWLDGLIVIKGLSIVAIKSSGVIFVSWPSRKDTRTGAYVEIAYPVTAEARAQANAAVMTAWEDLEKLQRSGNANGQNDVYE